MFTVQYLITWSKTSKKVHLNLRMELIRSRNLVLAWYFAVIISRTAGAKVPLNFSSLSTSDRQLSRDFFMKHLRLLEKRLALARKMEKEYKNLLKKRKNRKREQSRRIPRPVHVRRPRPPRRVEKVRKGSPYHEIYRATCPCVRITRLRKGTCYDFFSYEKRYCRPRPCRAQFVCVEQSASRRQCIRKKVVKRIVSNGDGTCRYANESGRFYYVPYA